MSRTAFERGIVWTLIFIGIWIVGCQDSLRDEPKRFATLQEAGTTHLAVLSAAPWAPYAKTLQPNFNLSSADALRDAIPDTAAFEQKVLDQLAVTLKTAAPTISFGNAGTISNGTSNAGTFTGSNSATNAGTVNSGTGSTGATGATSFNITSSGTITLVNGGTSSLSSTGTQTVSSGVLSTVTPPAFQFPTKSAADVGPASISISQPSKVDPILQRLAATALFQESKLLDSYVRDAAIDENYTPYLVRLQVSLMPRARNSPYDAYSNVSFFSGDFPPHRMGKPAPAPDPFPAAEDNNKYELQSSTKDIRIVPLLVTDDIEAMIQSRSAEQIAQFALALQAPIAPGINGEAGLNALHDKLRRALGRDLNSTFTIARVSDNTLRVRFGATYQTSTGVAMVPQTHNITLLVLLPTNGHGEFDSAESRQLHVVSRTSFIDAFTGKVLPNQAGAFAEGVREALARRNVKKSWRGKDSNEKISLLQRVVAANDYDTFKHFCGTYVRTDDGDELGFIDSLWTDLAAVRDRDAYQTATLLVPRVGERVPRIPPDATISPAIDDGAFTTIAVTPVVNMDVTAIAASITIEDENEKGKRTIVLPPLKLELHEQLPMLVARFPSLRALGIKASKVKLQLREPIPSAELTRGISSAMQPVTFDPPTPVKGVIELPVVTTIAPAAFKLAVAGGPIGVKDGQGDVQINVSQIARGNSVELRIAGAQLKGVDFVPSGAGQAQPSDKSTVVISGDGLLTLHLTGLAPPVPITIAGVDPVSQVGTTIVIPTVAK